MTPDRAAWFHEARLGMFLHWGAYSVAARGEWVANRERIPKAEYQRLYAERFQAENYHPEQWARLAQDAGMGYGVLTARHHDGFALWPTHTSDFHAGNLGAKRDLVGPFVEAFRSAGLKVGLYFSPADWFHPDYPGPFYRDWPSPRDWSSDEARIRFITYYRDQIRELLTQYGKIDYLWYDGCIPDNLQSTEANKEALLLQPHLLINERNGPPWHVKISEQSLTTPSTEMPWEACMTLNENWGYHQGDNNWKSARQVVQMLSRTASGAGNLLLNIGPRADGSIPESSISILKKTGDWLKHNRESISNTSRSFFSWNHWGNITTKGNQVYLHIWNASGADLCLAEVKNRILGAYWLETRQKVGFEQRDGRLFLRNIPSPSDDDLVRTIVLETEGTPEAVTTQTNFWIPG